ncbi:EF-hand domain-containing protein [Putridiphycobacter roseus]|uniref:EF-hand domain-containing protein n=1 Tax=Putridiphycobacter roseus TaxID=2219161 RepID=UPI0018F147DC|nr:EF-hand domain-containing protein [Putridiphycobacter roseus]
MNSKKIKTGIVMITLLFAFSANAQSSKKERGAKPSTFSELLEKLDANEDGKISKDEVKGRLKDNFDKIDTDKDGFISETEYENAPKPERSKRE